METGFLLSGSFLGTRARPGATGRPVQGGHREQRNQRDDVDHDDVANRFSIAADRDRDQDEREHAEQTRDDRNHLQ